MAGALGQCVHVAGSTKFFVPGGICGLADSFLDLRFLSTIRLPRQNSMALGLDARVPFRDAEAVSLAMSNPAEWKLHCRQVPKELLRKCFVHDLPEQIMHRPQAKFSKGAVSAELFARQAVERVTR